MTLTESTVQQALASLTDINTGKSYSVKTIRNIQISDEKISLEVALPYPAKSQFDEINKQFISAIQPIAESRKLDIHVFSLIQPHQVQRGMSLLPGVKNLIAVASGKGGVGKSTTAANLALALAAEGARVGLLDADIYGPSQPLIMGTALIRPESPDSKGMLPIMAHGLQTMSIGNLIDPDQAMIWRGPMASQALSQLINDTHWDNLDYLIVDMPPGTGDIQLTLAQKAPVTGAVIVTTPQDIALLDAQKGIAMFQKVDVPILGLIENMSIHICSQCGHAEHIFGEHGAGRLAKEYGVDLLGELPLDINIRQSADKGNPTVSVDPDGTCAVIYKTIARQLAIKISEKPRGFSIRMPGVVVENG